MDTCNTQSRMATAGSLEMEPKYNGNLSKILSQYMLQLLMELTHGCVDHFILLFLCSKTIQFQPLIPTYANWMTGNHYYYNKYVSIN
eukprot:6731477-Ditylum_brightwellii.AAC.1